MSLSTIKKLLIVVISFIAFSGAGNAEQYLSTADVTRGIWSAIDHIEVDVHALGVGATAPALITTFGNHAGYEYEIGEDSIFVVDLNHTVDTSEDIFIHASFFIDEAYSSDKEIRFQAVWSACPKENTEAVDACAHGDTADTLDFNIPANAKYLNHITVATIPSASISDLDTIGVTFSRIALADGDNPTAHPIVTDMHLEYTKNRLGD